MQYESKKCRNWEQIIYLCHLYIICIYKIRFYKICSVLSKKENKKEKQKKSFLFLLLTFSASTRCLFECFAYPTDGFIKFFSLTVDYYHCLQIRYINPEYKTYQPGLLSLTISQLLVYSVYQPKIQIISTRSSFLDYITTACRFGISTLYTKHINQESFP